MPKVLKHKGKYTFTFLFPFLLYFCFIRNCFYPLCHVLLHTPLLTCVRYTLHLLFLMQDVP